MEKVTIEGREVFIELDDNDDIKYPRHYSLFEGDYEVVDLIRDRWGADALKHFLLGNAAKYLLRAEFKGSPVKDYRKAHQCLEMFLAEVDSDD